MAKDQDWRLRGQEEYLQGATLLLKPYKAWSDDWEHDHCEFCWAKFMDPNFSPEHKRFIAEHPTSQAVHGSVGSSAKMGSSRRSIPGSGRTATGGVCPNCVADFAERFEWTVQP